VYVRSVSKRIHISVEWSGYYMRLSGFSKKATERLGKLIINSNPHRKRFDDSGLICCCSVHDITRVGAAHADWCPMAD
jgi:hypothetical protein